MKTVPSDGAYEVQDDQGIEARIVEQQPEFGLQRRDPLRSWLVSGIHFVDPRRRFGDHGRTRHLLVDRPLRPGGSERWQMLASALHRHSVRGGLSELSPEERRVITLAYMEGRTNREIAAMLGVSVATVRRRLWVALEHLDAYLGRTGSWLSAFILAVVTSATVHMTRLGRWISTAAGSTDKVQKLAATLTAGAVTAGAVGMVVFTSDSAMPGKSAPAGSAPLTFQTAAGAQPSNPIGSQTVPQTVPPLPARPEAVPLSAGTTTPDSEVAPPAPSVHHNNGCDGNPTSAPPPVPVGSPTGHPRGAPVTHPTAGGCKG
ncbi:MAG TPA: sigma factor-like helix-turn-helix DNA-binding protein [Candidatus Dormibacteraeota bacterium]